MRLAAIIVFCCFVAGCASHRNVGSAAAWTDDAQAKRHADWRLAVWSIPDGRNVNKRTIKYENK